MGRVIADDAKLGAWSDVLLIYVFQLGFDPRVSVDDPADHLLIPPLLVDASGWYAGVMKKTGSRTIHSSEVLNTHCFYNKLGQIFDENNERIIANYFNEYNHPLPERVEPCGDWLLVGHGSLQNRVAAALAER